MNLSRAANQSPRPITKSQYNRTNVCLRADHASGTDIEGQPARGYSGPITATVESTPLGSGGRLHHVTVAETPAGGQRHYRASDVTDNDLNDRRLESLQVPLLDIRIRIVIIRAVRKSRIRDRRDYRDFCRVP